MNAFAQSLGLNIDLNFAVTFASLILTRLVMVTATIPFLVGKPVPGTIRLGLAVVLLVFLYPYLSPANHSLLPQNALNLLLLFLKESFYGIAIGIAASIVFHGFQAAGGMIDSQRGAAQAHLLIPQLGEQSSVFGQLNFLLGIVLFLSLGGHLFFFKALLESYDLLPILSLPSVRPNFPAMSEEFMKMTGTVLLLSLQLTAPILISIFMADVVLGIMSKAAPAINVWELGFVVRGVLGVLVFFLAIGLIATQMGKFSLDALDQVERIIRFLAFPTHAPQSRL